MIEKIFNALGLTEEDYWDDECENDRFILNH